MRAEEVIRKAEEKKVAEEKRIRREAEEMRADKESDVPTEMGGKSPAPEVIISKDILHVEFPCEGTSATYFTGDSAPSSAAVLLYAVGSILGDFKTEVQTHIGEIRKENEDIKQRLQEKEVQYAETTNTVASVKLTMTSLFYVVKKREEDRKKEQEERRREKEMRRKEKEEKRKKKEEEDAARREEQLLKLMEFTAKLSSPSSKTPPS